MQLFDRLTTHLDRLGIWYGGYIVLSGAFSWTAKQTKFMEPFGWPEAIFIGVFAAAAVLVTISLALIAWRTFKPIQRTDRSFTEISAASTSATMPTVDSIIQSHIAPLEQKILALDKRMRSAEVVTQYQVEKVRAAIWHEAMRGVGALPQLMNQEPREGFEFEAFREIQNSDYGIVEGLVALGISRERVKEEIQSRTDRINTHNEFATLSEQDKERWSNPVEKRGWFLSQVTLEVYRDLLCELEVSVRDKADMLKRVLAVKNGHTDPR